MLNFLCCDPFLIWINFATLCSFPFSSRSLCSLDPWRMLFHPILTILKLRLWNEAQHQPLAHYQFLRHSQQNPWSYHFLLSLYHIAHPLSPLSCVCFCHHASYHLKPTPHNHHCQNMSSNTPERSMVRIGHKLFVMHVSHGISTRSDWKTVYLSQIHLYFEYDALIHYGRPFRREPQGYEEFCAAHNHFMSHEKGSQFAYFMPPESNPTGDLYYFLPTIQSPTLKCSRTWSWST